MTTSVLQEFLVKIGISVNQTQLAAANAGLSEAAVSATVLDKSATGAAVAVQTKLIPSLKSLLLPLAAITAAAGLAYREVFKFIDTSAKGFERESHLANRVNTTAEAIEKLGFIAQFSRSSVQAAESSLDGLNRAAGETALGVGRAKKIFEEIGLSVKDSNGNLKDTSLLMGQLGEKIKGFERGKQLAILEKLGIDKTLIETLTTDVGSLGDEFDSLYKNAGIDANAAAESSVKFVDSIGRLGRVMKAIKDSVAISFFDEFTEGFDSFRKLLANNLPKIISSIKPIIADMVKIGAVIFKLTVIFASFSAAVIGSLSKINDATDGWALRIGIVAIAWKKLNIAFLASPVGIIISLGVAFALLFDDYKVWERGGESFINWGGNAGKVVKLLSMLLGVLRIEFLFLKSVVTFVVSSLISAGDNLKAAWSAVADWFDGIFDKIASGIEKVVGLSKKAAGAIGFSSDSSIPSQFDIYKNNDSLVPSPSSSGPSGSKNITLNQKTEITVNGSGNPIETASQVKNHQKSVNSDQVRNMQGAVQ